MALIRPVRAGDSAIGPADRRWPLRLGGEPVHLCGSRARCRELGEATLAWFLAAALGARLFLVVALRHHRLTLSEHAQWLQSCYWFGPCRSRDLRSNRSVADTTPLAGNAQRDRGRCGRDRPDPLRVCPVFRQRRSDRPSGLLHLSLTGPDWNSNLSHASLTTTLGGRNTCAQRDVGS